MKYDLTKLNNKIVDSIEIEENYLFDETYMNQANIIKMDNVIVTGEITKDILDEIYLNLSIETTIYLQCAITLKEVKYPIKIEKEGSISELVEENDKKYTNTIDILPIIWENILMEVPMRVESSDVNPKSLEGNGWSFIREEDIKPNINPELNKLKDLL